MTKTFNFANFDKTITLIYNCEEDNKVLATALESVLVTSKNEKYTVVLLEAENSVGILLHLKTFEKVIPLSEAIREIKVDLDAPDTVFSGEEIFVKESGGIHPREFFKLLLKNEGF